MGNDVIFNKIETIERCINRIREVYDDNPDNLNDFSDYIYSLNKLL